MQTVGPACPVDLGDVGAHAAEPRSACTQPAAGARRRRADGPSTRRAAARARDRSGRRARRSRRRRGSRPRPRPTRGEP
jgi:hypothetical protein